MTQQYGWVSVNLSSIITTPGLLNVTLTLGFLLNHRDNLGTGINQFYMGNHTYVSRKLLKDCVEQHQVIAGGKGAPPSGQRGILDVSVWSHPTGNIGNDAEHARAPAGGPGKE